MDLRRSRAPGGALPQSRLNLGQKARVQLMIASALCAIVGSSLPVHTHAQAPQPVQPARAAATRALPAERPIEPGILPVLATFVPGVVLHGAGTFAAGDRRSAKRIFISSGVGFATFFVAGSVLAGTGTARRLVGPVTPFVIAGGGVFFLGWLADLYGAATGGRADTAAELPTVEAELGYRYVHDPQFNYGSFADARAHWRYQALRVSPSATIALDDDNQRVALEVAGRVRGRKPGSASRDGSHLDVTGGLWYHRYGSEHFAVWTPTLAVEGRLDLAHVGESLAGSFVEGQIGAGLELYDFDVQGQRARESAFGLLLARFGFGMYFGGAGDRRSGELLAYYDHRHDDFAAGLAIDGIGSGILGHLGLAGHYYLDRNWGLSALLELGSAVVSGVAVRYRGGAR